MLAGIPDIAVILVVVYLKEGCGQVALRVGGTDITDRGVINFKEYAKVCFCTPLQTHL